MKIIKITLSILLAIIFSFSFQINYFANSKDNFIYTKNFTYEKNNIIANGTYPAIKNLKNKEFENKLNKEILDLINNYLNKPLSVRSQITQKKINISYKTFTSKNVLSIVLYFKNINNTENEVQSIVIDTKKEVKLYLNSFLGPNALLYANKLLEQQAKLQNLKNPKIYKNISFYVENEKIYLYCIDDNPFSNENLFTITINPSNIKNYTVKKNDYYIKSEYNVKMLPLREPLEALGFKIFWNEKDQHITVLDENDKLVSYIKPTENRYSKGSFAPRALEFAPEVSNGITYVPISFFSDITNLLYSIDKNCDIIISKY